MHKFYPDCVELGQAHGRTQKDLKNDGLVLLDGDVFTARLKLPLPKNMWTMLFAWLLSNPSLSRNRKGQENRDNSMEAVLGHEDPSVSTTVATMTSSTLGQYKSAIKWFHMISGLAFKAEDEVAGSNEETLDEVLNGMINGYKRIVAEKKRDGIMSISG